MFVTAESDVSRLRPLGPPTEVSTGVRESLLEYMQRLYAHYIQARVINVNGHVSTTNRRWTASMTADAWVRYNQFEASLLKTGLESDHPDMATPTMDRLAKSGLKCALLLAASNHLGETVTITEQDIIRAFYYIEQWRLCTIEVLENIGKSREERDIELIHAAIVRQPNILRSKLMRDYHLTKRDADFILDTLDQRGLVNRIRSGRSERLVPI
jgi:hypothetical protein